MYYDLSRMNFFEKIRLFFLVLRYVPKIITCIVAEDCDKEHCKLYSFCGHHHDKSCIIQNCAYYFMNAYVDRYGVPKKNCEEENFNGS